LVHRKWSLGRSAAIQPLPEDWFGRWVPAVRRTLLADFALPIEIADRAKARAYHEWLNDAVMSELRSLSPETYQHVVADLRNFAQMLWDENDED
jgi:hypothetical protein